MALLNMFSPLNGGAIGTYGYPTESPYDLDAGLDYTRTTNTMSWFPFPVILGYVDGFVPLANDLEYAIMKGKTPFGPGNSNGKTVQGAPALMVFPNLMGSMKKVNG